VHGACFACPAVIAARVSLPFKRAGTVTGFELLPLRLAWWTEEADVDQLLQLGRFEDIVVAVRRTGLNRVPTSDRFRNW
jgi:hypothetical protein